MSNMPPPRPPRSPPRVPRGPGVGATRPAQRRPVPPADPHPTHMYEYEERAHTRTRTHTRIVQHASSISSFTSTTATTSSSSFSSYLGTTAGFASKARAALSTAGSYVASGVAAAATSASAASAASERSADGVLGERKQTWEEWARDWREGRRAAIKGTDTLYVVPGWAVKRPRTDGVEDAFDLHVSVSGFCNFVRDPESVSRTQRAIMSIAKRFAALPAPPIVQAAVMAGEFAESPIEAEEFEKLQLSDKGRTPNGKDQEELSERPPPPQRTTTADIFRDPEQLKAAREFMDMRLAPFWSSVLAYRRVAISMYPIPLKPDSPPPHPDTELFGQEPLMRTTFTTNAQGHFSHNVVVPWERICTHPNSLPMAFADDPANDRTDWGIVVRAQLLSEEGPNSLRQSSGATDAFGPADTLIRSTRSVQGVSGAASRVSQGDVSEPLPYVPRRIQGANAFFSAAEEPNRNDGDGQTEMGLMGLGRSLIESWTVAAVSRPGGIRIISDLDDTVKHTDILSGPREVFRNVFCRSLHDTCVPGMDSLYSALQKLGLSGLHFVSNSPFELFPVVSEFLRTHKFPSYYSLRLKFYGGRSIVSSLFEPAGERKRPSVLEIMNEFYDSQFILIGDSGEQDLELYSAIAHERPQQVAAIFIRDVTSGRVDELRTNIQVSDYSDQIGASTPRFTGSGRNSPPTGASTPISRSSTRSNTLEDLLQTEQELQQLSAAETKILRRAAEWEARTARAYDEVPPSVRLVFFEHVDEIEGLAKELVEEGVKSTVHAVPPHHLAATLPPDEDEVTGQCRVPEQQQPQPVR